MQAIQDQSSMVGADILNDSYSIESKTSVGRVSVLLRG